MFLLNGIALALLVLPMQSQDVTAITNVRVIDGNGGDPIENGVILIRGERISAVGPGGSVTVPAGASIINAAGKTAMPGLADSHVHLVGGWDGDRVDMLGYQRYVHSLVYSGVTTIFDTGNVLPYIQQLHQEIEHGRLIGPRIYFVGPLIDGADAAWPPLSFAVSSISQISGYVRQLKAAGVHAIKGYGGLSNRQLAALVRAAGEESLSVFVDAWSSNGSADVIRTGVRAFAHLPGDMTDEAVQLMLERDVACITTLAVTESFSRRRLGDLRFLSEPLIARTAPPWFLEEVREEATRPLSGADSSRMAGVAVRLEAGMRTAKRLFDAGVLLAAGTDAPYPGVFLGEGIHRELELLVEAGLTPLQAITVATKNAAILMNASEEWGTLEPGKRADIVIVSGNPAVRVGDTRQIEVVIKEGRSIDREKLEFDPSKDPGFRAGVKVSSGS